MPSGPPTRSPTPSWPTGTSPASPTAWSSGAGGGPPPAADGFSGTPSRTKSSRAARILGLRDEGRLALDDPIARHVPELAELRGPTADSPVITVRHLLTMSAGLATDDPWGDRQQGLDPAEVATFLRGPPAFARPPGTG